MEIDFTALVSVVCKGWDWTYFPMPFSFLFLFLF